MRDLLTATPTRSAPAPAGDERRTTEDEKRHDLSPTGTERRPHQRQTERRSTHERRRQRPETAPAPLASQPRRRSQPSQHRRAPRRSSTGTAHDTRAPLYSANRARYHARSTTPAPIFGTFRRRYLSRARAPRRFTAHTSAAPRALTFGKCSKNEMTMNRTNALFFSTFHALDGSRNGNRIDRQISPMRRINRRSTEPQRSGATFTFALNPGRAVALLGRPQINSNSLYLPRTSLTPKHVSPP